MNNCFGEIYCFQLFPIVFKVFVYVFMSIHKLFLFNFYLTRRQKQTFLPKLDCENNCKNRSMISKIYFDFPTVLTN